MYYEAGTVIKTHPHIPYNDGIRRIYLYVDGEISKEKNKDEQTLKNLLRYINESTGANVTDDNTRRLDDIVKVTKARKDVGINFMKSWERERELLEREHEMQERCMAEGMEKGMESVLNELLGDGTITQERAEEIKQRLSNA